MFILALSAIGYISAGFMGVAIGVLIGVVVEFVWKLIEG
jgi:tetrahydromethanopterin S-methyltransferase subunit F